jgi:branched-subunit amino acid transport protein
VALCAFIEGFDHIAPILNLCVVYLTQVQHLALHHLAARTALVLDNIPIAMLFAVFVASVESQEHANQLNPNKIDEKILGLHYRRFQIAHH